MIKLSALAAGDSVRGINVVATRGTNTVFVLCGLCVAWARRHKAEDGSESQS